ncbi:uncharacterized protein LOC124095760 [Marmota monax]|uniref:uncharacterized protein LOC124095760 n=1 Tax=Marmota monax TaxID=9995 RepID=UPI001EB031AE|nr:uncharacterized protein LOC124095760 [Marmota monax]
MHATQTPYHTEDANSCCPASVSQYRSRPGLPYPQGPALGCWPCVFSTPLPDCLQLFAPSVGFTWGSLAHSLNYDPNKGGSSSLCEGPLVSPRGLLVALQARPGVLPGPGPNSGAVSSLAPQSHRGEAVSPSCLTARGGAFLCLDPQRSCRTEGSGSPCLLEDGTNFTLGDETWEFPVRSVLQVAWLGPSPGQWSENRPAVWEAPEVLPLRTPRALTPRPPRALTPRRAPSGAGSDGS